MRKSIYYFTLCICCLLSSCQSSEQVISNAVKDLNSMCPINITNKGNIFKVEYVNNEIIFYTNLHYYVAPGVHSFPQIKAIERNERVKQGVMSICLNHPFTIEAFKDLTQSMAEEVDLKFKAISRDERNDMDLIFVMPWTEIQLVTNKVLSK